MDVDQDFPRLSLIQSAAKKFDFAGTYNLKQALSHTKVGLLALLAPRGVHLPVIEAGIFAGRLNDTLQYIR